MVKKLVFLKIFIVVLLSSISCSPDDKALVTDVIIRNIDCEKFTITSLEIPEMDFKVDGLNIKAGEEHRLDDVTVPTQGVNGSYYDFEVRIWGDCPTRLPSLPTRAGVWTTVVFSDRVTNLLNVHLNHTNPPGNDSCLDIRVNFFDQYKN